MITKREPLHMDAYSSDGIKAMDVHGPFSFTELKDEMIRALAHDLIPIVRRIGRVENTNETESIAEMTAESDIYVHWSYNGVEFEAEGQEEYVMRASREMMAVLEVMAK